MDVWLLRHAEAQGDAPSGRDEERELTPEGLARARAVARGLAALLPPIEIVLASPFRRALQTAEPCARALRLELPRPVPVLMPGTDPAEAASELARGGWRSVLIVGHQPLLGSLVGLLVFGDGRREVPLRKAAIARVTWAPGGSGTLEALLPPEILEKLGSRPGSRPPSF
ncbi:MAG TPA: phosphohistidine phosphatase SixA [Thermoanaerobaculia bacterium]|nr:phosphohistidine phosphatase SixA [Thermoanaerobaculia bacterium]